MPSQNVEVVNRIYEGWERGDFSKGVAEFATEVVMVIDPEIPDAGEYRGLEGIRSYTIGFLQAWETLTIAPTSIDDLGDRVLVEVEQTGVGRDSGVPVTLNYFHVWTFRDGSVVRLDSILRKADARKAAGLPTERPPAQET